MAETIGENDRETWARILDRSDEIILKLGELIEDEVLECLASASWQVKNRRLNLQRSEDRQDGGPVIKHYVLSMTDPFGSDGFVMYYNAPEGGIKEYQTNSGEIPGSGVRFAKLVVYLSTAPLASNPENIG
jgi:hypothetical protein